MSHISFKPISLADWQLVKVSGEDNHKYLQGQVTVNMNNLSEHSALMAAHCDAKGKMWSNLLLFQREQDIYYIVRKSVVEKQIAALKKYAIFSKVTIEAITDLNIFGLVGDSIPSEILAQLSDKNCVTTNYNTYIKLPLPEVRIIVISPQPLSDNLLPCSNWLQLDLEAGYAIIDAENMESLLPQACNLQYFDAISFDKGCYCGQEMVTRAQFRGANKRGLYLLAGKSEVLPIIGDNLEYQIDGNWRESGQVLAALKLNDNNIYVQVVLNNDIDIKSQFRIKGQTQSQLTFY
ncbi:tRNA-modifying protein YgfZ [uncultured Gilliamella sp.]|uniref:tRNA-modifying protein YgfZ n=1 Tax=uncultured Gilliamella sp. TaxID=1193505 RepID=UPI0025CCF3E1|nr:tRNA-modifying protein YgfZ [uncultured Gilliamella sp.]